MHILHSKKFPLNTQFFFRQSQRIIEILNSHRNFIDFSGGMNNILMRKSMAGIIADYRMPIISTIVFAVIMGMFIEQIIERSAEK